VQGKENTRSGHLRKLVGQATSIPAGCNTLTTVSGCFAVQLTISSAIGLGVLIVGLAYTSPPWGRGTRSATIPREMAAESALTGEAPRAPDPLLRTVSNK
jgi:hypothetical protein